MSDPNTQVDSCPSRSSTVLCPSDRVRDMLTGRIMGELHGDARQAFNLHPCSPADEEGAHQALPLSPTSQHHEAQSWVLFPVGSAELWVQYGISPHVVPPVLLRPPLLSCSAPQDPFGCHCPLVATSGSSDICKGEGTGCISS